MNTKEKPTVIDFGPVVVKKSEIGQLKEVDGLGVFANRDFKKGEVVVKWNTEVISPEKYYKLPKYEQDYFCHKRGDKIYFYPDPGRHVNRSDSPNAIADFKKEADVALRYIKKGEEISIHKDTKEDY